LCIGKDDRSLRTSAGRQFGCDVICGSDRREIVEPPAEHSKPESLDGDGIGELARRRLSRST
jgi:hypothetical protein